MHLYYNIWSIGPIGLTILTSYCFIVAIFSVLLQHRFLQSFMVHLPSDFTPNLYRLYLLVLGIFQRCWWKGNFIPHDMECPRFYAIRPRCCHYCSLGPCVHVRTGRSHVRVRRTRYVHLLKPFTLWYLSFHH